jgi:hypothetical protein
MKQPRLRFTIANTDWDALRHSAQQQERRRIALPQPSPNEDEVSAKVHATSVTPAEMESFTTFNPPLGEPRWMESSTTKNKRKIAK